MAKKSWTVNGVPTPDCHRPPKGWKCRLYAGHFGPCPAERVRGKFLHNVIAHPLLWVWPSAGKLLHERWLP
jgi:hypothetical protein